jgi:hypothetical protein
MTRAELLALAKRAEKAPAEMQGIILLQVLDALRLSDGRAHYRIICMIEIGAYESVAVWLVPEGFPWMLMRHESGAHYAECGDDWQVTAATPALALTAAALRARAEELP